MSGSKEREDPSLSSAGDSPERAIASPEDVGSGKASAGTLEAARPVPGSTLGSPPAPDPSRLADGTSFAGRYRIDGVLGRGGMGEVYCAHDETLERAVALKIVRVDATGGTPNREDAKRRLLHEARLVSALHHRNIVEIHDAGEHSGLAYLVLELCIGGNLRQAMREDGNTDDRLRWLTEIAEGLAHAHDRGIVHRDIKPENVLLTEERRAKVADFGIAKALKLDRPRGDTTLSIVGTPRYMSPEQLLGGTIDARADQYAWGIVAYELLTGAHPRAQDIDLLRNTADSSDTGAPELPSPMRRVLSRAMAHNPVARYADFHALLADLQRQLGQGNANEKGPPRERKSGMFFLLGAAGAVAVAAGAFGIARARGPSEPQAPQVLIAPDAQVAFDAQKIDAEMVDRCAPPARPSLTAGLQLWRDASRWEAIPKFEEAAKLDPECAPASLYYLLAATHNFPRRPEHYRRARELRAKLGERERALLDVMETSMADPPDFDEVQRRAAALSEENQSDLDVRKILVQALARTGRLGDALAAAEETSALQPNPVPGIEYEIAMILVAQRDVTGALERFDRCLRAAPDSADCLLWRSLLYSGQGACTRAESGFRHLGAIMPDSELAHFYLGNVLLTTTHDSAAGRTAFEERWRHVAVNGFSFSPSPTVARLADEYRMAAVGGDLERALGFVRKWHDEVATTNSGRFRGDALTEWIELLRELGETDEARALARKGLREHRAWTGDTILDVTIELARLSYLTGAIDAEEFRRIRDDWMHRPGHTPMETWLGGFAGLPIVGADMTPPLAAGEYALDWHSMTAESFARASTELLRAGRIDDAVQHADAAANWCLAYSGTGYIHAQLAAARAHDAAGDTAGACKRYAGLRALLIENRGAVSFRAAEKRMRELSCGEHTTH